MIDRLRILWICLATLGAIVSGGFWHGAGSSLGNFATATHVANIYALRKTYPPYAGPAIRLQRADSTQMDFSFNAHGDLPRQAIQDWAQSRSIAIATIYDQSPVGNNITTVSMSAAPILTLVNAAGYPEVTVAAGQYMITNSASSGQGLQTVIVRLNATGGVLLSQDIFNLQFRVGFDTYSVAPNGGGASVGLGSNAGVWANLAGSFSNLYSTNNVNGYQSGGLVASASIAAFTFAPSSGGELDINHFRFGGQDYSGSWQEIVVTYDELSKPVVSDFNTSDTTYYSTPLPDTLTGLNPVIANMPATQFTVGSHFIGPFGFGPNGPTNVGTVVTDANGGSTTDSATLTITGDAGATLTGTGLTGSNPYNIAGTSAASLTTILQNLEYASTSTVGAAGTLALTVTSSAGSNASASMAISVTAAIAETPYPAPAGCTFTPPTFIKGVNISDAQVHYPAQPPSQNRFSYIYPQAAELSYFASKGMTAIRLPTEQDRLQPFPYQPLDPVSLTRTDGFVGRVDEQASNAGANLGTQTNLIAIKTVLDQACSLNMYVLLEPHDFGTVFDPRLTVSNARNIGVDAEGTAMFVDWWTRVATKFKNYPNIIFQEENEPAAQNATQWQAAAALATTAIASVTTSHIVMLQGVCNDSALEWVPCGNAAAWAGYTPPAGLSIVFEAHQYLDSTAEGIDPVCAGTGSSRLVDFTNWLTTNGFKGFIGEFGWSQQSSCMTSATTGDGPTYLAFLSAHEPLYVGWTWWLGGSSAFEGTWQAPAAALASSVVPVGYPSGPFTDAPQMATLVNNLP